MENTFLKKDKPSMAKLINLHNYLKDSKQKRAFSPWQKRFGEKLDIFSRLSDISDRLLCILAKPDNDSSEALRELVMAVLDKGTITKYYFLDDQEQRKIDSKAIFLKQQIYFEMMMRLGWIPEYACQRYSLVVLIENYGKPDLICGRILPILSGSDPDFAEYIKLSPQLQRKYYEDRFEKAFVAFKNRLNKKS